MLRFLGQHRLSVFAIAIGGAARRADDLLGVPSTKAAHRDFTGICLLRAASQLPLIVASGLSPRVFS
jgi:hypothetical protein